MEASKIPSSSSPAKQNTIQRQKNVKKRESELVNLKTKKENVMKKLGVSMKSMISSKGNRSSKKSASGSTRNLHHLNPDIAD